MTGGATTTNMNDTFVAATFEARILPELRPAVTTRDFIRWAPDGPSTAHTFSLLGDPGIAEALTQGTDYTTVTDITTDPQTATVGEVGLMSTVSDVLMKVSLLAAAETVAGTLSRSVLEKWETDLAAIADNFNSSTTASGATLTPSDLLAAVSAIEQRDAATGPLAGYLHPKQTGELRDSVAATTAIITAKEDGVPMRPVEGETNGRGYFGNLFGVDIYQTSLVASSGGLRQGSIFVKGQAIGAKELWAPRVETERRATLRGVYVVASACYGLAGVEVTNRGQMLKSAA